MENAPMLTAAEVARWLHVGIKTVYAWAASGQLVAHRFGRAVRFAENDVKALVERSRDDPPTRRTAP